MSCHECKTGSKWVGDFTGREEKLNGQDVYVTGDSSKAAILVIPDMFGWTLPNIRILADRYAEETSATVFVPDFFGGEIMDPETLSDPDKANAFDFDAFLDRNSKEVRWPEIEAAARTLKSQFPKVGAIGFCYGGWASFKLSADPSLVDAISVAHPSMLDKTEVAGVKVPVQILSAEHDHLYTEELKQYTFEILPRTGVQWEYVYFPDMQHGFAVRGDINDKRQRDGLARAERSAVRFFKEYLY